MPKVFRTMVTMAKTRNENIIPAAVIKKLWRTMRVSPPPWLIRLIIFSDKTGRTQGIRFRIKPPIIAKSTAMANGKGGGISEDGGFVVAGGATMFC